jgi:hypothetical protein
MANLDDRNRVRRRFNLLDLAVVLIVVGLIPLAHGAFVLFTVPAPSLKAVEPPSVPFAHEFRVKVTGEHLRPYMRVSLNDMQGRLFLFKNRDSAEVVFGDIPPGQYDVVLYDFSQERARLTKALTVAPPPLPTTKLDVVGFMNAVTKPSAQALRVGTVLGGIAEIMTINAPGPGMARITSGASLIEVPLPESFVVPMRLRIACNLESGPDGLGQCRGAGTPVGPGVYLHLDVDGRRLPFLISEVRPAVDPILIPVRVRLASEPASASLVKPGDVDFGVAQNPAADGAVATGVVTRDRWLSLRVPAFPTLDGWSYMGKVIRVGGPLTFMTTRYQVTGTIQELPPLPERK